MNNHFHHKRTLKKVRRGFLNRQPLQPLPIEPENAIIAPPAIHQIPRPFPAEQFYTVLPMLSFVEVNRKLICESQALDMHYNVTVKIVQDISNQKKAHCVFNINPNNIPIPWRCTVQRLESYGDADLKDWARRIEAYYLNYSQVIKSYFDMIKVDQVDQMDQGRVKIGLRKAKKRAMNAIREVEEKSLYFRTVHFSNEEGTELLSGDLHEEFLNPFTATHPRERVKELNFTLEDFATLTERNGILTIFDHDSEIYLEYTKKFFECITLNGSPMQIHPEYTTIIFRKDGTKKEVIMQNVVILEPTPSGIFTYTYYVIVGKGKGQGLGMIGCEETLGEKSLLEEIREDIEKGKDEMIEKCEEKDQ